MSKNADYQREFKDRQLLEGKVRLGIDFVTPEQKEGFKAVLRGEAEIVYKPGMKKL